MLGAYLGVATLALFIWVWGGGADSGESLWLNKKDRHDIASHEKLTYFGRIVILSFTYLWNFIVLPWMIIYYTAKGIKKLIIKDTE